MTQRTRLAIVRYWLSQQRYSWRRYSRFIILTLASSIVLSQAALAAETRSSLKPVSLMSLISKEKPAASVKAVVVKAPVKKPATSVLQETEVPMGKIFELPGMDPKDEKAEGTTKFLRGSVSTKNHFGVAVVYGIDPIKGELEMWSEFNRSTKLSGYKNFAAIEEGDSVELQYKQLKKTGKKILLELRLVAKKPKEEPAVSEEALPSAKPAAKSVSALSAVKL